MTFFWEGGNLINLLNGLEEIGACNSHLFKIRLHAYSVLEEV